MNDELEQLREVVRSLVAHRIAWFRFTDAMNKKHEVGAKWNDSEMEEIAGALSYSGEALDRAMARLAKVDPKLVSGFPFRYIRQP